MKDEKEYSQTPLEMLTREPERHGFWAWMKLYLRQVQRYLVTGLLVWIPLFFTIWVSWWLISNVGVGIDNIMRGALSYLTQIGARRFPFLLAVELPPGTGIALAIVLFLTTGLLTRYLVWRKFIAFSEELFSRIPLFSKVYVAVQQIRDVFINRKGTVFQEVVLVEYPRKGLWVVAFVTSRDEGVVQQSAERPLVALFLPTTPNPTSGYLIYCNPDELIRLHISVEDAMKLIVSGGAYLPPTMRLVSAGVLEPSARKRSGFSPQAE